MKNFGKVFLAAFLLLLSPAAASAATLSASPTSSTVSVGDTVSVYVVVSSVDRAMNAVSSTLSFPSDIFEVTSVSKNNSIITLWVQEPSFSNSAGTISFEGVVLNPGFTGASGRVITATLRAKSEGTARLLFSSGSVLANDGQGTEILTGSSGATITVGKPSAAPQPAPVPESGASVTITSATHPDQAKWYANSSPKFSWDLPTGALEVRTLIGENPKATPNIRYAPAISSKEVADLADGTYYFYVQVRTSGGLGPISRFQINIDKTPPKKFDIVFPDGSAGTDPKPKITFRTSDVTSGIDRYEVKIGSLGPLRVSEATDSSPYTLPLQEPGLHTVVVTAFDRSGNSTSALKDFVIEGIDPPTITDYPQEDLKSGDLLSIRGTTYPNAEVTVRVRDEDGTTLTEEGSKSNSLGDFSIVIAKGLGTGVHTFTADVVDQRGARSPETEPLSFTIRGATFDRLVSALFRYGAMAFFTLVAVGVAVLTTLYMWLHFNRVLRRLRKEGREAERVMEKSFAILRRDVRTHILRLRDAKTKRGLTREETLFLKQFDEELEEARSIIAKELSDVSGDADDRK